jgi:tetratricopeptide (TPR) repeat protein
LQRQKLAEDNPSIPRFQRYMAADLFALGWRVALAGRKDEALGYYEREEAIRLKLAESGSATLEDREGLVNCQNNMADLLRRSGRLEEALAACERARALREPLGEADSERPGLRAISSETYLRLGQVRCDMKDLAGAADAWKRACAQLDGARSLGPEGTFRLACGHACLADLAGRPGSGVSAADGTEQADAAMAGLRQAVAKGYRRLRVYQAESGLDSLRSRPDFLLLMMDLAFPAELFAH